MDCGATCLRMLLRFYGKDIQISTIRKHCKTTNSGVNFLGVSEAAQEFKFNTYPVQLTIEELKQINLPSILHWSKEHFVVLYKIKGNRYYLADPAFGKRVMSEEEFKNKWLNIGDHHGGALIIEPNEHFFSGQNEENEKSPFGWGDIINYFKAYRKQFLNLFLVIIAGMILQLVGPFLTQSLVDHGISSKDLSFITIILIGQLFLFVGGISVTVIRGWILLHISSRVNIEMLKDFIVNTLNLPYIFFDKKTSGDIMQRMEDQARIESFISNTLFNFIFSILTIALYSVIVFSYSTIIFLIVLLFTLLYFFWIFIFMKYRRVLDNERFNVSANEHSFMIELIGSVKDIKMNNAGAYKRKKWEYLQTVLFNLKIKTLKLNQIQSVGSSSINQLKNIIILYVCAKTVVQGSLTLGELITIQYIIGMINGPIETILGFAQSFQDAKISIERLRDIHNEEPETDLKKEYKKLLGDCSLTLKNINFRYYGAGNKLLFENFSVSFPQGKTTAIVGMSGSGKTTILKLLMRYYDIESGEILVGSNNLNEIDHSDWRANCGSVLVDGFIYSDTIEKNITMGHPINPDLLREAIQVANLEDFIQDQPFGLETKLGSQGNSLSQGQKQRLLIARAVYKRPKFIFLDEATNALDAHNEKIIIENLAKFFENKTVIVVAHRLSTVKDADNIIVLDKGNIVEEGNHNKLISLKGDYYRLIKNQLELGT